MITLRPASQRGRTKLSWLDGRHTFSFGDYVDPVHHRFRALRVINEDRVQPAQGFGTRAGDGAALSDERAVALAARSDAEVPVFDLA